MKKYTREVVVKGHVSRRQLGELLMSIQQLEHLKAVASSSTRVNFPDILTFV